MQASSSGGGTADINNDGFTDSYVELPFLEDKPSILIPWLGLGFYGFCLLSFFIALLVGDWLLAAPFKLHATLQVVLLVLTGILQHYLSYYQKQRKKQGYLNFYNKTSKLFRVPFVIVALGTGVVLLAALWPEELMAAIPVHHWARLFMVLELGILSSIAGVYANICYSQQESEQPPDMQQYLFSSLHVPQPVHSSYNALSMPEMTMELIRIQQDRLAQLSKEILRLQAALDKMEKATNEGDRHVDMEHVLAGKEQELRAMTAERDQLLSELRLGQSLIGKQEEELQRLRKVNQQHVDESARLRAMLDEWSARNAKLELALYRAKASEGAKKKLPEDK